MSSGPQVGLAKPSSARKRLGVRVLGIVVAVIAVLFVLEKIRESWACRNKLRVFLDHCRRFQLENGGRYPADIVSLATVAYVPLSSAGSNRAASFLLRGA